MKIKEKQVKAAAVTADGPKSVSVQDTIRIEAYSLWEFCKDTQEAITAGYKFDFDSNENFPTTFGTMYQATLVKG